jgi:hypothetical protein
MGTSRPLLLTLALFAWSEHSCPRKSWHSLSAHAYRRSPVHHLLLLRQCESRPTVPSGPASARRMCDVESDPRNPPGICR